MIWLTFRGTAKNWVAISMRDPSRNRSNQKDSTSFDCPFTTQSVVCSWTCVRWRQLYRTTHVRLRYTLYYDTYLYHGTYFERKAAIQSVPDIFAILIVKCFDLDYWYLYFQAINSLISLSTLKQNWGASKPTGLPVFFAELLIQTWFFLSFLCFSCLFSLKAVFTGWRRARKCVPLAFVATGKFVRAGQPWRGLQSPGNPQKWSPRQMPQAAVSWDHTVQSPQWQPLPPPRPKPII